MSDDYTLRSYDLPHLSAEEIKMINVALQLTFNMNDAEFAANGFKQQSVTRLLTKIAYETSRQEICNQSNIDLEKRRIADESATLRVIEENKRSL
jgi:hypothetical protein